MTTDRDLAVELLSMLVSIDSVNPSLVPGAAGESAIARAVTMIVDAFGLDVQIVDSAPNRPNVVATLRGTGGGKSLMLNAHMDTVGLGEVEDPLTLRVDGDRAYGRGAYDMKGSLTAMLLALENLSHGTRLRGDVILTAVADEEHGSIGTQAVLRTMRADGAVVTEPTSLKVCVAHKGFAWIEIETQGVAAHGSQPSLGVDAIGVMGDVLAEFNRLETDLASGPTHPLLGPGSLHASLIRGGQELSTYPARCLAQLERRTLPGETAEDVRREVEDVIAAALEGQPRAKALGDVFFWRDAFSVPVDAPIVQSLLDSARKVMDREPEIVGENPWMDSAFLCQAGIPTVVFGPGGSGAHADVEWVSLPDIQTCADVLVDLASRFCG